MDLFDILANERIIVFADKAEASIFTWNGADTMQCWRPIVRYGMDYVKGKFDPFDFEEVGILTQSGYGPKTYDEARKVAVHWHYNGYASHS